VGARRSITEDELRILLVGSAGILLEKEDNGKKRNST